MNRRRYQHRADRPSAKQLDAEAYRQGLTVRCNGGTREVPAAYRNNTKRAAKWLAGFDGRQATPA